MTEEEIKQYVEEIIENLCNEDDLVREEVIECSMLNCLEHYYEEKITREDIILCSKYLEYEIDIDWIDEVNQKRKKSRDYQRERRKKKRTARKEEKIAC